ncbi:MAG: thioredoxin family protein [Candidatus Hydrothermarchaeales archaeon]
MEQKKTITLVVVVVIGLFMLYSYSVTPLISDANYTYISGMTWYNTYEAGQKVAIEENKPMLVYVWAIWCQFCEKLHTEVYPDPKVSKYLKEDFVLIAIDLDKNRGDAQKFGAQYPPFLVFLTPTGEKITEIPGYIPAEELSNILEVIVNQRQEIIEAHEDLPHS